MSVLVLFASFISIEFSHVLYGYVSNIEIIGFMCNNNFCGGNIYWIIILILLFCNCGSGLCGGGSYNNNCGCDNNCGCC